MPCSLTFLITPTSGISTFSKFFIKNQKEFFTVLIKEIVQTIHMQCERLIKMIKSWYLHVREETMAPARMVTFIEEHASSCDICLQDPDLKEEISRITELILPESKIPKAVRQKSSVDDEVEDEDEDTDKDETDVDDKNVEDEPDDPIDDDGEEEEDLNLDDDAKVL